MRALIIAAMLFATAPACAFEIGARLPIKYGEIFMVRNDGGIKNWTHTRRRANDTKTVYAPLMTSSFLISTACGPGVGSKGIARYVKPPAPGGSYLL